MNMSYARFRNTATDLDDCQEHIELMLEGDEKLSPEELQAAKRLVKTCINVVTLIQDLLPEPVELDQLKDHVDTVLEANNNCAQGG